MTERAAIDGEDFERLIREHMALDFRFEFAVERLVRGAARLRLRYDRRQLRPGGTLSGPVMFTLADTALYAAVLSVLGLEPLAVTTHMSTHFLRRPRPADLIAEARILRGGRRLFVGEVDLYSEGEDAPVARVTGGYALPAAPSRSSKSSS